MDLRLVAGGEHHNVFQLHHWILGSVGRGDAREETEALVDEGDQCQEHPTARAKVQINGLATHAHVCAHVLELGRVTAFEAFPRGF